jgi:hypothetical protein
MLKVDIHKNGVILGDRKWLGDFWVDGQQTGSNSVPSCLHVIRLEPEMMTLRGPS